MIERFWETLLAVLCFCWLCESCESKTTSTNRDRLVEAFIQVESSGNASAINRKSGATGCLQLMPILVQEANRLSGYKKYKLSDRKRRDKSVEIFHLIMRHKNPGYDLAKACIIWNPNGGYDYLLKVEKEYNQLINKKS